MNNSMDFITFVLFLPFMPLIYFARTINQSGPQSSIGGMTAPQAPFATPSASQPQRATKPTPPQPLSLIRLPALPAPKINPTPKTPPIAKKTSIMQNIEEWEIVEDKEGNLKKIVVHREVKKNG